MDLKDVVALAEHTIKEAGLAFHAGHHDESEKLLMEIMVGLGKYFDERTTPAGDVTGSDKGQAYSMADAGATKAGDVTESATSETPDESLEETQEKVSPPGVHPAVIDPAAAAQQEALDQAGP